MHYLRANVLERCAGTMLGPILSDCGAVTASNLITFFTQKPFMEHSHNHTPLQKVNDNTIERTLYLRLSKPTKKQILFSVTSTDMKGKKDFLKVYLFLRLDSN